MNSLDEQAIADWLAAAANASGIENVELAINNLSPSSFRCRAQLWSGTELTQGFGETAAAALEQLRDKLRTQPSQLRDRAARIITEADALEAQFATTAAV